MIGVFDNVCFYVIPATARRLQDNNDKMVSLLRTGAATLKPFVDDDVTHVICNNTEFSVARKSVNDSAFCYFVTPKWVFISQLLHYSLPVVSFNIKYGIIPRKTILLIHTIFSQDWYFIFLLRSYCIIKGCKTSWPF